MNCKEEQTVTELRGSTVGKFANLETIHSNPSSKPLLYESLYDASMAVVVLSLGLFYSDKLYNNVH